MSLTRRALSIACGALLGLSGAARPTQAEELKAQISIRVIYAVKDGVKSVDPALKDIEQELKELPADKFRLLDKLQSDVQHGATVELQFPGNRSIAVTFDGLDVTGEKAMLSLQLAVKPRLKMQARVANGGRMLVGGPDHLEGKLILDVSAHLKEPATSEEGKR
jgi:hypothetical protein